MEPNTDVKIVVGVNDTSKIRFTCQLTGSSKYDAILNWKKHSEIIPACDNVGNLAAGEVCTTGGTLTKVDEVILNFGKIVRGKSDGIYTCTQSWKPPPGGSYSERSSTSVTVTVQNLNVRTGTYHLILQIDISKS